MARIRFSRCLRGALIGAVIAFACMLDASADGAVSEQVIIAGAVDGYQVVFSWPELFNTEVGSGVLVVFERDGQPFADREGRVALVSARDLHTGPRSVKWLARLDVKVLKE
jgi:hypothetical protein